MWHHRISEKISNLSQQLRHLRPVASLWKQTARLYDAQGILGTSIGCREEATKNLGIFSRVNWKIYMGIINDFRTDFRQNSKQKQKCSKMTCQKYKCKDTAAKVRVFLLPTHTIYRIEQWVVWVDGSLWTTKLWTPQASNGTCGYPCKSTIDLYPYVVCTIYTGRTKVMPLEKSYCKTLSP